MAVNLAISEGWKEKEPIPSQRWTPFFLSMKRTATSISSDTNHRIYEVFPFSFSGETVDISSMARTPRTIKTSCL